MPNALRDAGPIAAHLAAIGAVPRPAGGPAEAAARGYAAAALRGVGYEVAEVPFTYSDVPGRLGTPVAGMWTAFTFGATAVAGARGRAGLALAVLGAGVAALAVAGVWVGRVGTVRIAWRRRAGVNLVATPRVTRRALPRDDDGLPGEGVRVWLVAHLDTKSQPVAMVARVGGVVAAISCALVAGVAAMAELATGRGIVSAAGWVAVGLFGVVAAVPIAATTVGADSDGALDNASGVAAVLGAAEALAADGMAVGVLLTSAEELGLAGARAWAVAWARAGRVPAVALNCDGVDDAGPLTVLRGARLTPEVARALGVAGGRAHVRRIPPGLLVDAVAFAAARWGAVTVSKGTWATLARVHTRRDTLAHLRGDGVGEAAALLAALARVLASPREGVPRARRAGRG